MRLRYIIATLIFAVLLYGFWTQAVASNIVTTLGGHIFPAFLCFALLLAALWFPGFADVGTGFQARPTSAENVGTGALARSTRTRLALVLAPALFVVPYLLFSIPRHELRFSQALGIALLPVACAALLEFTRPEPKFTWQDFLVLSALAATLMLRVFSPAWPYAGLGSLPKLYLADVALYLYLFVRRLPGIGYSFIPTRRDFAIGLREWLFFMPFALGLGFALHFITFIPRHPSVGHVVGALLVIFLLTAVPEELFFRGILQNLLEARLGRTRALIITAILFGLSHFPKGATFNWRYVILAAIAGIFYGRAWRDGRHLFASSFTHTLVDVIWGLWFR